jgi:hypothetical protein
MATQDEQEQTPPEKAVSAQRIDHPEDQRPYIPDATQLGYWRWLLDRLFSDTPPAYPPGYGPTDQTPPEEE